MTKEIAVAKLEMQAALRHTFGLGLSSMDTMRLSCKVVSAALVWCAALAAGAKAASAQGRLGTQAAPHEGYWAAFIPFYDGDFQDALKAFREAARGAAVTTAGPGQWVDSICYHAMMGECNYQLGRLGDALDHYSAALKLFAANSTWMLRIDFDAAPLGPDENVKATISWGASARTTRIGRFPRTYSSFRGRLDNASVLRTGGIIEPAEYRPVYAVEVVRCTALALSRRREIMGPACQYDPLTGQLLNVLARRPGPPNHWSQCWIELQLGLAYASMNQVPQAASELQKSLLAAGQFDHPLTCLSLLELGRLAFEQGKYDAAGTYFHEATISGAYFQRYDVMEEAFRLGGEAYLLSGKRGVYAPLVPAVATLAKESRVLQVSLLATLAAQMCSAGDIATAATTIAQARTAMQRKGMALGALGGRVNYQAARIAFHAGDARSGAAALSGALAFQKAASSRLFQIGLADNLYRGGGVSERMADLLFGEVLREPTERDWLVDPLDTLAAASTPHPIPYQHWFEIALSRKDTDKALEIAEQIRRHRFFTTQPLGGRLLVLRWVLEGPVESLSEQAALARQQLLIQFPKYAELSRRAGEIRTRLAGLPPVPADEPQARQQAELLAQLAAHSAGQEALLQTMALERVACELAFPPRRTLPEIRREIPQGTLVLYYLATSRNIHAFALARDRYGYFTVAQPAKLKTDAGELLRLMGNHDRTQPVSIDDLNANGWRGPAERLAAQLTNGTDEVGWAGVRELVVIPDGILWYLPLEALLPPIDGGGRPLLFSLPVRYAPTLSLAIPGRRGNRPLARTVVVAGKMLSRDDDAAAVRAAEAVAAAVEGSVILRSEPKAASGVFKTVFDRLIVLKEHDDGDKLPFGWSPLALDAGKAGGTLADWMQLPLGGVDQVVLPAFHTAAEYALRRGGTGDELFLAACGLMASGCRTVLLSRWRVGGQSTVDLMREFVQELPHEPAAVAWRRSVQLASNRLLDPALEGRLRTSGGKSIAADHPFFWSGYMVLDTGVTPEKGQAPAGNDQR